MSSKVLKTYDMESEELEIIHQIDYLEIIRDKNQEKGIQEEPNKDVKENIETKNILNEAKLAAEKIIGDAEEILRQAHSTKDAIYESSSNEGEKQGYTEGLNKGYTEGYQKAQEDFENEVLMHKENMASLNQQAKQAYGEALNAIEADVVKLAIKIAEKIVANQITVYPETVLALAKEAIVNAKNCSNYILYVAPTDYSLVAAEKGELQRYLDPGKIVTLLEDKNLSPGNCILETDKGRIDCLIDDRLKKIQELIQNES